MLRKKSKINVRLVKPKFFLPVHGEYNHALKHGQTGIDCGVLERNVYIMVMVSKLKLLKISEKARTIKTGKVYIDNQLNHKISDDVILDRQTMAKEGIVMIVAKLMKVIEHYHKDQKLLHLDLFR